MDVKMLSTTELSFLFCTKYVSENSPIFHFQTKGFSQSTSNRNSPAIKKSMEISFQ